jgi:hypothetical protein
MKIKATLTGLALFAGLGLAAHGQIVFSQYVETNSGTIPKGIEIWNTSASIIDFEVTNLDILKGVNGGAPSSDFTLNVGTMAAGEVIVIGTADIGTYLDATFGASVIQFYSEGFTFNGDDSLVLQLDGITLDTFGIAGTDPGTAWSGDGVSTANQNIALLPAITTGTGTSGFTDPSTRFETISSDPNGSGGLAGFGVAPVPEPSSFALLAGCLAMASVMMRRRAVK